MGKAKIIGNYGAGKYRIEVDVGSQIKASKIAALEVERSKLLAEITVLENQLVPVQADIDAVAFELNLLLAEIQIYEEDRKSRIAALQSTLDGVIAAVDAQNDIVQQAGANAFLLQTFLNQKKVEYDALVVQRDILLQNIQNLEEQIAIFESALELDKTTWDKAEEDIDTYESIVTDSVLYVQNAPVNLKSAISEALGYPVGVDIDEIVELISSKSLALKFSQFNTNQFALEADIQDAATNYIYELYGLGTPANLTALIEVYNGTTQASIVADSLINDFTDPEYTVLSSLCDIPLLATLNDIRSGVISDVEVVDAFIDDLNNYLSTNEKEFYANSGLLYKCAFSIFENRLRIVNHLEALAQLKGYGLPAAIETTFGTGTGVAIYPEVFAPGLSNMSDAKVAYSTNFLYLRTFYKELIDLKTKIDFNIDTLNATFLEYDISKPLLTDKESEITTFRNDILTPAQNEYKDALEIIKTETFFLNQGYATIQVFQQDIALIQIEKLPQNLSDRLLAIEVESARLSEVYAFIFNALSYLKLKSLSLLKEIVRINNIPAIYDTDAWCVDYTENATGNVATIEIPGEPSRPINIAAGGRAPSLTDGKLRSRSFMTGPQAYFNAAILPGWQKFKPTYRRGTITSINTENNTANLTLYDDRSTAANFSGVGLVINQTNTLSNVPIVYLDCNAFAFKVGDDCVIEFQGQNWNNPKLIGFVNNPRPCTKFTVTFNITGTGGTIVGTIIQEVYFGQSTSPVSVVFTDPTAAVKFTNYSGSLKDIVIENVTQNIVIGVEFISGVGGSTGIAVQIVGTFGFSTIFNGGSFYVDARVIESASAFPGLVDVEGTTLPLAPNGPATTYPFFNIPGTVEIRGILSFFSASNPPNELGTGGSFSTFTTPNTFYQPIGTDGTQVDRPYYILKRQVYNGPSTLSIVNEAINAVNQNPSNPSQTYSGVNAATYYSFAVDASTTNAAGRYITYIVEQQNGYSLNIIGTTPDDPDTEIDEANASLARVGGGFSYVQASGFPGSPPGSIQLKYDPTGASNFENGTVISYYNTGVIVKGTSSTATESPTYSLLYVREGSSLP
jgi:hypothetical protein